MAGDGAGDSVRVLSYFRVLFYQKNMQGFSPSQAGHSYQLSIYDALCLSILIDICLQRRIQACTWPKEGGW
jgi:hypothetical protein